MEYNVKYHLNEEKKIKDHHKDNKMIIFSEQGHKNIIDEDHERHSNGATVGRS